MKNEERKSLYAALSAPFPPEAVERTQGKVTGRGYNTTGLKAQYVVNRLNEILGIGGWRMRRETIVREVSTSSGRKAFEAVSSVVLELGEWAGGVFVPYADAVADGGHISTSEADARKGSVSNAVKRAAAMLGVGKQAYEGTLDDDNVPADVQAGRVEAAHPPQQSPTSPSAVPTRNRLTANQLRAVWAVGRKAGYDQQRLRAMVKTKFNVQPEFLTREQASAVISGLTAESGNGHAEERLPGQEG